MGPLRPRPESPGEIIPNSTGARSDDAPEEGRGRPMPRDGDPTSGITLEAAPEHFFDQERWDEFASCCGSREKALQRISHPDPEHFAWYRLQVAEQQTPLGAKAREAERTHRLGERLVRDFRARLISGEYVATGFQPPSIERVRIPAELHSGLDFDFENGTEKGDGYTFSHILIIQSCGSVGNGFGDLGAYRGLADRAASRARRGIEEGAAPRRSNRIR